MSENIHSLHKLTKAQLIERLHHCQEQLFSLLDALPEATLVVDHQQVIRYINAACCQWLGIDPSAKERIRELQALFPSLNAKERWEELCEGQLLKISLSASEGEYSVTVQANWHTHYQVYLLKVLPSASAATVDTAATSAGSELEQEPAAFQTISHNDQEMAKAYRMVDERFRFIAENANDGFWDWDLEKDSVYRNRKYNELLGIRAEDSISMSFWEARAHPADFKMLNRGLQQAWEGEARFVNEFRFLRDSEGYRWYRISATIIRNAGRKPCRMVGTLSDIHNQRVAEQTLLQQTETLRSIQAVAKIGEWRFNVETKSLTGSEEFYNIYEIDPAAEISIYEQFASRVPLADLEVMLEKLYQGLPLQDPYFHDYQLTTPSGAKRWVYITGTVGMRDNEGKIREVVGLAQDITQRKEAELALYASEARYRLLAEYANDMISLIDLHANSIYVSPSVEKITGFSPEQWSKKSLADRVHPEDVAPIRTQLHENSGQKKGYIRYRIKTNGGTYRWMDGNWRFIQDAHLGKKVMVISRDVTEEVKAREELERHREYFQSTFFNNTTDALFLVDIESQHIVNCNDTAVAMFEARDKKALLERTCHSLQQNALFEGQSAETINTSYPPNYWLNEEKFLTDRGRLFWGNLAVIEFREDTQLIRITDITKRKQAELALQKSEAKYRLLTESAVDIIMLMDLNRNIQYVSPSVKRITGFTPDEWISLAKQEKDIHPGDMPKIQSRLAGCPHEHTKEPVRFRILCKDDSYVWVEGKANLICDDQGEYKLQIVSRDVTQEVQAQLELEENRQYFQSIFNNTTDALFLVDVESQRITDCNDTAVIMFEVNHKEELVGKWKGSFRKHLCTTEENGYILETFNHHQAWKDEVEYVSAKGNSFWGNLAIIYFNETTQLVRISDITERKKAEEKIRESESKYRLLAENANDLITLLDLQGNPHYVSPSVKSVLGYTVEEWNFSVAERVHPDDRIAAQQTLAKFSEGTTETRLKYRERKKDGSYLWMDGNGRLIKDDQGRDRVLVISRDITQEVIAKEELEESRQYFQSIFNNSTDALFLVDSERHIILDCNDAAVEMFGTITKEGMIGRQGIEFHRHQLTEAEYQEAIRQYRKNPEVGSEIEYISKKGRIFWGYLAASQFDDTRMLVRVSDITLLKEKEQAIRRAEELYRQVVETQQEMICRFLPDTTITFVNPAYCRFVEKSEQELMGSKFIYLLPPMEELSGIQERILDVLEEAKKQARPAVREFCVSQHGEQKWLYWTAYPIYNREGTLTEFQAVGMDITRRKLAEEKLRKSEEQLREAQLMAKMGSFEYDLVHREGTWSAHLNQIFEFGEEYQEAHSSIKKALQVIHPDDVPQVTQLLRTFIQDGQPRSLDYRLQRADGSTQYVTTTYGKLYRDADGKPVRLAGTFQDITGRKRVEQELRAAKRSLEQASKTKDWILSVLSHEVRNSLNAIAGFANLLNHSYAITHREEITKTLAFSSRHLLALINNIHDFSKIELGKFELQSAEFDLYDLFEKATILFRSQLRQHITLKLTIDEQTPRYVKGDATRLHQILNNLVGNAIKFTEKGSISIRVKRQKKTGIQFVVEDTGVGISEETMTNVFKPLYQADDIGTKNNTTNLGLGLYIVSKLVDYVGGAVDLSSIPGKGTSIRVVFPIEVVSDYKTSTGEDIKAPQDVSQVRVLYIEDDYFNRMLMAGYAQLGNLELSFAKDAEEAYALLSQHYYDIVLTDIVLSGMDGAELARQIKRQNKNDVLPVVAVTAYSVEEIRKQGKHQHFDAVLTKPIDPNQLYHIIYQFCSDEGAYPEDHLNFPVSAVASSKSLATFLQSAPGQKNAMLKVIEAEIIKSVQTLQQAVAQQNYLLYHKTLHTLLPFLYLVEAREFAVFLRTLEDLPAEASDKENLQQKMEYYVKCLKK